MNQPIIVKDKTLVDQVLAHDQVLAQIQIDVELGDMTAIAELIETLATEQTSRQVLNDYIGEESQ